jgi:hypothetical protein
LENIGNGVSELKNHFKDTIHQVDTNSQQTKMVCLNCS